MTLDASQVRVPGTGEIFVAPVGTAAPTSEASELNAAFVGLGYTTEDGVTITPDISTQDFPGWQSVDPLRTEITGLVLTAEAEMMQFNPVNLSLLLHLGDFTDVAGSFGAAFDAVPQTIERALVIDWQDGDITTRMYWSRVRVDANGALQLSRSTSSNAPLSFVRLAPFGGGSPGNFWTNDAAFDPAS